MTQKTVDWNTKFFWKFSFWIYIHFSYFYSILNRLWEMFIESYSKVVKEWVFAAQDIFYLFDIYMENIARWKRDVGRLSWR